MIRVVHSHPVWLPSTMTWLYNQVCFLPPDVESHIVCEWTQNLDQFSVPHIHSLEELPSWKRTLDLALLRLRFRRYLGLLPRVAKTEGAEILHSHFGNVGWANLQAARATGLKHVVTFYGRDISHLPKVRPLWRERFRELFAGVDLVLCEGTTMAAQVAAFGCPPTKLRVHHLGVRLEELPFRPREWNQASGEPLRVLISGMFRQKKGIPYALHALGEVSRRVPLEITVIGDASPSAGDQEEKRKILAAVATHDLTSRVRFLGIRPYSFLLQEAYRNHLFLSPSVTADDGDTEGGVAVSVIEMAATGMPVVATSHCDTPGVITHGVSGLLAPERDVAELVQHIGRLTRDQEQWLPMVTAARRHIEAEFDAKKQGDRLAVLYKEVLDRHGR
jgi:colanic acid/amylovoran biosynthesis glycosyltransferase